MINIEIKKVTSTEVNQLQQIGRQTFSDTFSENNSEENMKKYLDEGFKLEKLSNEINNPDSEFYFAIENNNVIGYVKINKGQSQTELKDEKISVEIERIYVLKEFQGKRIGQLLYEKAMELALQLKADYIWLGVWEENPRAIKFYQKNGFIKFDKHIFKLGDDEQVDIMMKLELKSV
jgi:ribosomal protein S18 acetylase RimI-like enzyme